MTQYLLSVHSVEGEVRDPMTEEEMQQSYAQVCSLEEETVDRRLALRRPPARARPHHRGGRGQGPLPLSAANMLVEHD